MPLIKDGKIHITNPVSPAFLACGLPTFRPGTLRRYDTVEERVRTEREPYVVTCRNCRRTLLAKGDSSNAIKKLLRR